MYRVKTIVRSHENAQEMAYKLTSSRLAASVTINKVEFVCGEKDRVNNMDAFELSINTLQLNETIQMIEDNNAYRGAEILVEDIQATTETIDAYKAWCECEDTLKSAGSVLSDDRDKFKAFRASVIQILKDEYNVTSESQIESVISSLPKSAETNESILRYSIASIMKNTLSIDLE